MVFVTAENRKEVTMFDYSAQLKSYEGKTLKSLAKELAADFYNGYSVFVLQDENDNTGVNVDESFSLGDILKKHPELSDMVVKTVNDFYGLTVFRVIEAPKKCTETPETCNYCAHNPVCDHNIYGFENCGHFLRIFI